ncbi:pilin [Patescibacteria group bacterium]
MKLLLTIIILAALTAIAIPAATNANFSFDCGEVEDEIALDWECAAAGCTGSSGNAGTTGDICICFDCSSDDKHNVCNNGQCIEVDGLGADECHYPDDCATGDCAGQFDQLGYCNNKGCDGFSWDYTTTPPTCSCTGCDDPQSPSACNTPAGCNDACGGPNEVCMWDDITKLCECYDDPSPALTEGECRDKCGSLGYDWDDINKTCTCGESGTDPDDQGGTKTITIGPPWGGSGPQSIPEVINNVIDWALGIAGAIAVLFIIIGGIRYTASAGNQQLQEAAKKTLTSAIIGFIIVILAFVIIDIIFRVLTSA